ncbi:phosphoglycerate mutase family protein [Aquibacillus sp. 3ASR75-11]|uniref:Phosphoglycerate mutase family protein n=1 Tax=Terrihalobacillus insolitus TaxID=2950438 RepID=A0A9X3WSN4_9BACI|nr:histidine phosphatase family protein [Terrihalobacillus insolitus]MDC3412972.1 phosphoglycerate mutase family protein [Terrihalobacillus insolitus]MDC3424725.1 phosphoglycerate mutase family protein [Terrihalobacillus insolitus]
MKKLFLIRHCNAEGQHKDSPLTKKGVQQAQALANFFDRYGIQIDRIVSSPYLRAIESIKPYAENRNITVEVDDRLQERILSEEPIDDWLDVLEQSFSDMNFKLPGGESSNDAISRIKQLLQEIESSNEEQTAIFVTHGNLLALLLKEFQADIGFSHWKGFTNPDIFMVQKTGGEYVVERIWKDQELYG